ncbi:DUF3332 domain-containing protein [Marinilabiliaceae bacterium ANBcel2]|nr:DUF3332 domain-containing protein [Marinilabiliaceae bacterium ANBcel2]
MRKLKITGAIVMALTIGSFQTSCIGSFQLTNNVYDWNKSIGNKWANEVVFLAMLIVPVYSITLLVDGVVLNSIEFWSGSSPLAMESGETETQIVKKDGVKYKITASQNRFDFVQLEGDEKGKSGALVYDENEESWSYIDENEDIKLVELTENQKANIYLPGKKSITVTADHNGVAAVKEMFSEQNLVVEK